jgi:sphinganine C4-monooxygenase
LRPAMNKTACPTFFDGQSICFPPTDVPFYHTDRPALIPGIPDYFLAVGAPIFGYWGLSLFFHALDVSGWKWLVKYRIHESADVKGRNLATRSQVVWAVLLQQAIQTLLGLAWVTEGVHKGPGSWRGEMDDIGIVLVRVVTSVLGRELGGQVLQAKGPDLGYFLYWWGIPAAQFCLAMHVYSALRLLPC